MDIPGISASDGSFGAIGTAPQSLDRDAFLELLVSQLRNQDPLAPTENGEFIAQLAQFSSLEELGSLNETMLAMIALNQTNAVLSQLTQGSALIGHTVSWSDPVSGESSRGIVESVLIEDGQAMLRIDGHNVPLATVTEVLGEGATTDASDDAGEPDDVGPADGSDETNGTEG